LVLVRFHLSRFDGLPHFPAAISRVERLHVLRNMLRSTKEVSK